MVGTTNRWWATMLPQNFEYPPKLKGEDRGRSSITNHLDDEMDSKFGGIDCRFFFCIICLSPRQKLKILIMVATLISDATILTVATGTTLIPYQDTI